MNQRTAQNQEVNREELPQEIPQEDKKRIWERCVAFHGHECGGLTIGYKAALYAVSLLGLRQELSEDKSLCVSADEELVCVAENDACGVDAIQVILGCSVGKGNLLFHITGKQAFSFYDRRTGKSVRLVLKPRPEGMSRSESFSYYQSLPEEEMFEVKETRISLPERAKLFSSKVCACCGESAAEHLMRLADGKAVCLDCFTEYDRFRV